MSPITTHVLDTAAGKPAAGVPVVLARRVQHDPRETSDPGTRRTRSVWEEVARGATDADGRIKDWFPPGVALKRGVYQIVFDTGAYFKRRKLAGFYPEATIVFEVRDPSRHYHVPLLLSPFGYSTYRGS